MITLKDFLKDYRFYEIYNGSGYRYYLHVIAVNKNTNEIELIMDVSNDGGLVLNIDPYKFFVYGQDFDECKEKYINTCKNVKKMRDENLCKTCDYHYMEWGYSIREIKDKDYLVDLYEEFIEPYL